MSAILRVASRIFSTTEKSAFLLILLIQDDFVDSISLRSSLTAVSTSRSRLRSLFSWSFLEVCKLLNSSSISEWLAFSSTFWWRSLISGFSRIWPANSSNRDRSVFYSMMLQIFSRSLISALFSNSSSRSYLLAFLYRAFATEVLLALPWRPSLTSSTFAFFSMMLDK